MKTRLIRKDLIACILYNQHETRYWHRKTVANLQSAVAQHGIQWQYMRDRLRTIGYFLYDRDTLPEEVGQIVCTEGAGKDSTNLEEHADEIEGNKREVGTLENVLATIWLKFRLGSFQIETRIIHEKDSLAIQNFAKKVLENISDTAYVIL